MGAGAGAGVDVLIIIVERGLYFIYYHYQKKVCISSVDDFNIGATQIANCQFSALFPVKLLLLISLLHFLYQFVASFLFACSVGIVMTKERAI